MNETMKTRRFNLTVTLTATIEVADEVIKSVDDEWRESFFPLKTERQIISHIAANMLVHSGDLYDVEGFAQFDDRDAKVVDVECDVDDIEEVNP